MTAREFVGWPKIARLGATNVTVSEKIDGTNAAVVITEDDIFAQSRTRVITPEADNFGFALWVQSNAETLRADLGVGRHFGEWYGSGIQRKYGFEQGVRFFALFDDHRWHDAAPHFTTPRLQVVPALYVGPLDSAAIEAAHCDLMKGGSVLVPGWPLPEGVVVYVHHSNVSWKITDAKQGDPSKHKESTNG